MFKAWIILFAILAVAPLGRCEKAPAPGSAVAWNKAADSMDVDVRDIELIPLLERVAAETGWRVYVEPDPGFKTSAKFKGLQTGQALRRILGDLNFTLMPQTNGAPHLYVFRTVM